ncbi:MAG TPA: alpha-glucosidase family protein [Alphaproteobacteria bacterium]|nr:alpha-glucosidase family protein [Alphaproteobacteria bacterium]
MSNEWWRGAVIYQIYPRSFYDTNGDGIGDLAGITARLPYIAELGVDAIWLCPFYTSPQKDFGYDVADYFEVDPAYGTLEHFDTLIERAHDLGLKVIIDQVWSHTSDAHPWFRASRTHRDGAYADWYVWADPSPDGTPPNNWLSVFGGSAWTWEPRRRQYYLHHFLSSQPQLNLRNERVLAALGRVARFWLKRGVDGFRLDAIDFMLHDPLLRSNPAAAPPNGQIPVRLFRMQQHRHDMLQPGVVDLAALLRRLIDRYFPGVVTLGEVSSEEGAIGRIGNYTGARGSRLHMAYTLGFMKRPFSRELFLEAIAESVAPEDGWICWTFSNHDVERAVSRWSGGKPTDEFARLLMALLLTMRGSVCIYQGEELGLSEARLRFKDLRDPYGITFYPEFRGRDGSRTPMPWSHEALHAGFTTGAPWLPIPDDHVSRAVDRQAANPGSLLNDWRRFLHWRKSHAALRTGDLRIVPTPAPFVAFERFNYEQRLLVALNFSGAPATLSLTGIGDVQPIDALGGASSPADGNLTLPGWGVFLGALPAASSGRSGGARPDDQARNTFSIKRA